MARDHLRQCAQDGLDALGAVEQAERADDGPPRETQPALGPLLIAGPHLGDAVGDDDEARGVHPVVLGQDLGPHPDHHHGGGAALTEQADSGTDVRARLRQHRVHRGDDRPVERV